MTKLIILTFLVSLNGLHAADTCEIKPEKYNEFMKQDFDTFDQKPNGGAVSIKVRAIVILR